jgi:lipopolysaccharide/colanic/teichoic acid biosynthesis glycosyltransferase
MSHPLSDPSPHTSDWFETIVRRNPRLARARSILLTPVRLPALSEFPIFFREVSRSRVAEASADSPLRHRSLRIFNVVVALIGLIIAAPVMIVIAVAVKLTSRGPVVYSQTRVGLDRRWRETRKVHEARVVDMGGRPFTMYKFRTMVVEAEHDGKAVWAASDDARVTTVGRFLRRTRLDELPQLVNVLKGDMNIVGPRPERPAIFLELRNEIPSYHLRQRVMPGITGLAQITQSYDTCIDDVRRKVDLDLEYVRQRSLGTDLSIMVRTLPVMVRPDLGW